MGCDVAMEYFITTRVASTRATGSITKCMGRAHSSMRMAELHIKEIGAAMSCTAKVFYTINLPIS